MRGDLMKEWVMNGAFRITLHGAAKELRHLLGAEERWTQGGLGKDKYGDYTCDMNSTGEEYSPVCFCLVGGVRRVTNEMNRQVAEMLFEHLVDLCKCQPDYMEFIMLHKGPVASFNDKPGRKHEEVVALLDKLVAVTERGI